MQKEQQAQAAPSEDAANTSRPTAQAYGPQPITPPGTPEAAEPQAASDAYAQPGWSWGAFMNGPLFLIGIRKYVYLLLYLLYLIPFVNFIAWIGIMIFMGVKGRELAAESKTFTSREQYVGFMKAIDHAGKVIFFFTVALIALALIGVVIAGMYEARTGWQIPSELEQQLLDN